MSRLRGSLSPSGQHLGPRAAGPNGSSGRDGELGAQSGQFMHKCAQVARRAHPTPFGLHLAQAAQEDLANAHGRLEGRERSLAYPHPTLVQLLRFLLAHSLSHTLTLRFVSITTNRSASEVAFGYAPFVQRTSFAVMAAVNPNRRCSAGVSLARGLLVRQKPTHRAAQAIRLLVVDECAAVQLLRARIHRQIIPLVGRRPPAPPPPPGASGGS